MEPGLQIERLGGVDLRARRIDHFAEDLVLTSMCDPHSELDLDRFVKTVAVPVELMVAQRPFKLASALTDESDIFVCPLKGEAVRPAIVDGGEDRPVFA